MDQLLDKIISDNINLEFFQNEVPYEQEETRSDGKVTVRQKGSLSILDDWIRKVYQAPDWEPIAEMLNIFRDIRKKRQKPAHAVDENVFDQKYFHEQRNLIQNAYQAVRILRLMFGNHPDTRNVQIRKTLENGDIWTC